MTDAEINEQVAGALGLVRDKHFPSIWYATGTLEACYDEKSGMTPIPSSRWLELPNYCTDIAAAWEIVEQLTKDGFGLVYAGQWQVTNGCGMDYEESIASADTAPMAICLAFLKLKGIK